MREERATDRGVIYRRLERKNVTLEEKRMRMAK
jgi:hypothetical protein